jgi:hypothetical protein
METLHTGENTYYVLILYSLYVGTHGLSYYPDIL